MFFSLGYLYKVISYNSVGNTSSEWIITRTASDGELNSKTFRDNIMTSYYMNRQSTYTLKCDYNDYR